MKKSITALVASVASLFVVTGVASAQLPQCPPGTTNPGYCETPPTPQEVRQTAVVAVERGETKLETQVAARKLRQGRSVSFAARASTAGRYVSTLTLKGGTLVLARGSKTVPKPGPVKITLTPTNAGKRYIRSHPGVIQAVLAIAFTPDIPPVGTTSGTGAVTAQTQNGTIRVRRNVRIAPIRRAPRPTPRPAPEPNFTG